jgi:pSer/pThr/pTyr-binding forkhead associated (FHA) protein/catechol 2,3-dioxygenase-like lactoylglutathione lyase family enzyme
VLQQRHDGVPTTDARQCGLVSELTASGAALQQAHELAQRIAGNAPLALAAVKQVLRETQTPSSAEGAVSGVQAPASGSAELVVKRGPNAGSRFVLSRPSTSAGRHPASDIYLDDIAVSRHHAEFRFEHGEFSIVDAGSLNGTYVNRQPVDSAKLTNGDEIHIGKFRLVFLTGPDTRTLTQLDESEASPHLRGADRVMDTNTDNQRREPEPNADIASCVVRVANLDRSLKFYCDVFACRRLIRDADMALMSTAKGFLIYLHEKNELRRRGVDAPGVTHLMWATDSESELHRIAERLRAYDNAMFFHTVADITIVEGADPDGYRVIVTCPSARQLPRTVIADRLRG